MGHKKERKSRGFDQHGSVPLWSGLQNHLDQCQNRSRVLHGFHGWIGNEIMTFIIFLKARKKFPSKQSACFKLSITQDFRNCICLLSIHVYRTCFSNICSIICTTNTGLVDIYLWSQDEESFFSNEAIKRYKYFFIVGNMALRIVRVHTDTNLRSTSCICTSRLPLMPKCTNWQSVNREQSALLLSKLKIC